MHLPVQACAKRSRRLPSLRTAKIAGTALVKKRHELHGFLVSPCDSLSMQTFECE